MQLETRDLSVFYGDKQAVQSVSLSFSKGEVTALIGPSGCGKSSYLRCLNRMNDFTPSFRMEGDVLIDGQNIYAPDVDPVLIRRKVGMVFQKANPFPKSIFENVAWAPRLTGISKKSMPDLVEKSLRQAALWEEVKDRLQASALSLSGGQQQRLCIARAIAMDPGILLMDEPCSALDPVATAKIEELIRGLSSEYTIVIVTHNMHQASRVSDVTAFFLNGRLVEYGATESIFRSPTIPETKSYIHGQFG